MGLSLLAGCDNEKQQIFKEAEKDLEQGSYEYALDEFTTSVNNGVKPAAVSYTHLDVYKRQVVERPIDIAVAAGGKQHAQGQQQAAPGAAGNQVSHGFHRRLRDKPCLLYTS